VFMLPFTVLLVRRVCSSGHPGAVVALKGCDQVLRYSLDKSTTELLYLPLAARLKLQVNGLLIR